MAEILSSWTDGLPPSLVAKAEEELGETPHLKSKTLYQMKKLIKNEPGFHPLMNESFLLRFLRAKKYDVHRAFKTLKNYYAFKAKYSGYISDVSPNDMKAVLEMNKLLVSPTIHPKYGGVIVITVGSFDLDVATPEQQFAATLYVGSMCLNERLQVCGMSCVFDFQGLSARHVMGYLNPTLFYIALQVLLDCIACRIKGMHIVHEPSYLTYIYNKVWKHLLPKKIVGRSFFHGSDLKNLHEHIEPEFLPKSLGGTLGLKDYDDFKNELYGRQSECEAHRTYMYKGKMYPLSLHKMWKK